MLYIVHRGCENIVEPGKVRVGDALYIYQVNTWERVVEVGIVGVTQRALVVPDYGLCLVGAVDCDVTCCGGDAVVAEGGGDVTAAEEEPLDLGDGGAEEAVVEGGVGDERREENVQVGLECCVGLVI